MGRLQCGFLHAALQIDLIVDAFNIYDKPYSKSSQQFGTAVYQYRGISGRMLYSPVSFSMNEKKNKKQISHRQRRSLCENLSNF